MNKILVAALCTFSLPLLAQTDCFELACNELEKAYCTIKQQGQGESLPSFEDFQRNDATIQRLLLKRPAKRLGIPLPNVGKRSSSSRSSSRSRRAASTPRERKRPTIRAYPKSSKPVVSTVPEPSANKPVLQGTSSKNMLSNCKLLKDAITCPTGRYRLATNLSNGQLSKDALKDSNKVSLPRFKGDSKDDSQVHEYLGGAYERYIDRMLYIGLGGTTMSYTKFYHTFVEIAAKGGDFATRFEKMYHFLKRDKATIGVKSRYSGAVPDKIDQCDLLNSRIIVCDNITQNWVYRR